MNISEKKDIYDVNSYTDDELYQILDLSNPSDRELEAKIHHMIWKYDNFQNNSGEKLSKFFQDIYDHFFDKDDDDETNVQEGFSGINNGGVFSKSGEKSTKELETMGTTVTDTTQKSTPLNDRNYGYSINVDYSKDNLNPLLKQTTKRIINIDSQYRENKNTNSTNYTFNLSTPLRDVVSLKLYSYNIPYTWYTISKSYGSNFFYLKGNSPGIDDGKNDIQIKIGIGNYLVPNLITAVNNELQNLKKNTLYSDISFGSTGLSYDNANTLSSLTLDIQKTYSEAYYKLYFNKWTSPTDNINRTKSIPAFLGFNFGTQDNPYIPSIVYSSPTFPLTYGKEYTTEDTSISNITLDATNNYFNIINYSDINAIDHYDISSSQVNYNIKIEIPYQDTNTPPNNIFYSRHTLTDAINSLLNNNIYLNKNSRLNRVDISNGLADISNAVVGYGFSQYRLNIILNRSMVQNIPNSKVVVQFPPNDTKIWCTYPSQFRFTSTSNELSTITSETPSVQTNYKITNYPTIKFICNFPYYKNISANNYSIRIPPSTTIGYTLNQYLTLINNQLTIINSGTVDISSNPNGVFNMSNTAALIDTKSLFNLNVDLAKIFTIYDYYLDISNSFLTTLGLFQNNVYMDVSNNIDMSGNNSTFTITGTTKYASSFEINNKTNLLVFKPKSTRDNKNTPYQFVDISNTPLFFGTGSVNDMSIVLNKALQNYTDTIVNNRILSNSNINITYQSGTEILTTTLTLKIVTPLRQQVGAGYSVYFVSQDASGNDLPIANWTTDLSNSWYQVTKLSKPVHDLSNSVYNPDITLSYSTITGSDKVSASDSITLTDENNKIIIEPVNPESSNNLFGSYLYGVYTGNNSNSITLIIPAATYTRDRLLSTIGDLFNSTTTPNGQNIAYNTFFTTDSATNNTRMRFNINKIYTASDYLVNFYDPFTYTACYNIGKSVQNTTWDSTLGWILGFHEYTEYILSNATDISKMTDQKSGMFIDNTNYKKTITLTGDTSVSTYIYNSFLIILDDYNQNHMNDGLITTSQRDTNISLPSYASRAALRCDPKNKNKVVSLLNTDPSATGDNTNPSQLLSEKQMYSSQSILNAKNGVSTQTPTVNNTLSTVKSNQKYYSSGPFAKDVFAIVPLKLAGQQQNTPYVDFSGTLQNQERLYFGPVNIHRMTVQLKNDRGELVDLNNANWSFSLICEQLYQQKKT